MHASGRGDGAWSARAHQVRAGRRGGKYARLRGFTLIELMIAVLVIGILASVAIPSYQAHVENTRRSDGKALLLETAQILERCYTTHGSYDSDDCDINASWPIKSEEGFYEIADPGDDLDESSFLLAATPKNGHSGDECGELTLTATGSKGVSGAESGVTVDGCW